MSAVYEIEREIRARMRDSDRTHQKVSPITYVENDVAYLASVYPERAFEGGGQFNVPPMPPCEHDLRNVRRDPQKFPPAFIKLRGAFLPLDEGEGKINPSYTPAVEQAKDWAQRYADLGVFVPVDPTNPKSVTKGQVEEAIAKLEVRFRQMIEINDQAWRDHGTLVTHGISTGHIAAKHFGLDRDWAVRAGEQDQCRFCQKAIKSGVWKCNYCNAVLDWEMAYEAGACSKEEMQERLTAAKGRKKAQEQEEF